MDSPSDYGVEFQRAVFRSRREDVKLDGWQMPSREGMPTVIFAHGVGAGRTGDGMTELGAMLNRKGFGILMFDLRAHGLSEGKRTSGGWHERLDILGAYDYLLSLGVGSDDIGLLGVSMGAAAATLAAAEETGIGALALDTPYASASELILQETAIGTPFPEWFTPIFVPGAVFLARALFDIRVQDMAPERAVSELDYPVMVIHGTEDSRIPPEHSRRVFDASAEGSALWVVEGVGHAGSFVEHKSEYADRVERYLLSRLRSK